MAKKTSKRVKENSKNVDPNKAYTLQEAIEILKKCVPAKYDETVEVALKLGVDPRKADQQVRGTVSLPHGTGKTIRVLVFAKGDKEKEALDAGADFAGSEELLEKVKSGWMDFDAVISTPDMMRNVGKLGKILGPRGLMPSPKAGNVTMEVSKAVAEIKAGKVEFKVNKSACIHNPIAKLSFENEKIAENICEFVSVIKKAKPASSKGVFLESMFISSTQGLGLKIDLRSEFN